MHTNYLIIGSGIAGLTFALKIANRFPDRSVTIVTKSNADESNTKYAQGGIAVVIDKVSDNFKKHIEDTLICGDGLCDQKVVEMVITNGPKGLQELINWGAKFDLNEQGNLDLGREGGHSTNRVVHHKDQTGYEIERAILAKVYKTKNIHILDYHLAFELITKNNRCFGAYVLNEKTNEIIPLLSDYTLLATGGIGQIYGHTTNPVIATGDGIAMAKRANAKIVDMEFIQFHPTALYDKNLNSTFLISEAVRGFGAVLRNQKGEKFMLDYDPRGDLASRDIVSQSIENELKKSDDNCVYLDCTHLEINAFINHFPMIYSRCKEAGIDIEKDWIPVVPAQHYLCGGISVDLNGQTSINNLFACGECSRTGLHGANRLASNSLLEAIVYSDRIYTYLEKVSTIDSSITYFPGRKKNNNKKPDQFYLDAIRTELQNSMRKNAGIIRNDTDLEKTKKRLENWRLELLKLEKRIQVTKEFYELKNMITVSLLIVTQSMTRNENRGGFIKSDILETAYSHQTS